MNWYEVWADETHHGAPYVLLLRSVSDFFEILDPAEGYKRVFESKSYEEARLYLLEDEFTRVGRKEPLD